MIHLMIERLRLRLEPGAGHEHRIGPIATRAAVIFAERLHERLGLEPLPAPALVDQLVADPVRVDLASMSDAAAAGLIAGAWLAALTPVRQRAPEFAGAAETPATGSGRAEMPAVRSGGLDRLEPAGAEGPSD
jgi:hypothetical protein